MNNTFILKLQVSFNWRFLLLVGLLPMLSPVRATNASYWYSHNYTAEKSKMEMNDPNYFTTEDDDCDWDAAQTWMKTYNLIVFQDLTNVRDVDYNTFVGGDVSNIAQSGNHLQLSSYSKRSLEVAGKVKSGNDINIFYSGAFGNYNTIAKQNTTQYTVNGRRFNVNHGNQGATLSKDNTLSNTLSKIKSDLENLAQELKNRTANNTLSFGNNGTEARFNVNSKNADGIAIFNITDSQVFEDSKIAQIVVNNTANASTILINVSGKTVTWQTGNLVGTWLNSTEGRSKTLWNFHEATTIAFSRNLMGALLAPKADLQTSVDINGSVVVKSLNSTASIRQPYFAGNLCSASNPTPTTATLAATVMLQGPYTNGSMTTTLNALALIPKTDPYSGTTTVPSIPAGVTDWINIEVRSNVAPSYGVIAKIPAFVKSNGTVVDKNGNTPVDLGVAPGTYRIAIRHRNHLGIMTSKGIDFNSGSATINFYNSSSASFVTTYGGNAQVSLGSGKYAMWAGDVNGDGVIYDNLDPSDVDLVIYRVVNDLGNTWGLADYDGVTEVYDIHDLNLDGNVFNNFDPSDSDLIKYNVSSHPLNYFGLLDFDLLIEQLPTTSSFSAYTGTDAATNVSSFKKNDQSTAPYSISLYPNPVSASQLTIEMNTNSDITQANILIYNTLGSIIKTEKVDIQKGNNRLLLDASNLNSGNYLIRIQSADYISEPIPFVRVAR